MGERICENCDAWRLLNHPDRDIGLCTRLPPVLNTVALRARLDNLGAPVATDLGGYDFAATIESRDPMFWQQPVTLLTATCLEFQPRLTPTRSTPVPTDTQIGDLPFRISLRARKACIRAGISTLGDLAECTLSRLMYTPRCGTVTALELQELGRQCGLPDTAPLMRDE